ncbi:MAG: GMC family oxidoreductase [Actinomycetota bacterium]|jgi:choline dehydrogenase-like flavoprotein
MPEHYDIIVIGSGAGGGTLTYALAPTGKRILLLERGGWLPREKENWSSVAVWGDKRYRNSGQWTDQNGKEFTPKQHYCVGGNTKVYGAILFRMRQQDFGAVRHVDGVSPAWPIAYGDLEPWYAKAEELYCVHGVRGVDPTDPPGGPYPYPPISHEPRIEQLADDLRRAGLNPFYLPNGILIDEARPERSPCIRCDTCDGFPCLVNAKADAQVICVEPALRHPNVTLLTNSRVIRLETNGDARSVSTVVVERDGQREEYTADVVALSAGAINSAALLLASASDDHPQGLGNSSGVVGRHLMLHNNSSLIAISRVPNPTRFQKTLGINDFYYGDGDWEFPLGAMQMLGRSDAFTISFDAPDADDPADLAAHSLDFWLTTEDLPEWGNRVEVTPDGRIHLSYTPTNLEAHKRLNAKFRSLLGTMRCKDDVLDRQTYLGGLLGISGVAHQNGTVRFGTDPRSSALDLNCKMHDLDNLYVVDSSFFVSSSAVNPTLTIIANALRVADHIAERLR